MTRMVPLVLQTIEHPASGTVNLHNLLAYLVGKQLINPEHYVATSSSATRCRRKRHDLGEALRGGGQTLAVPGPVRSATPWRPVRRMEILPPSVSLDSDVPGERLHAIAKLPGVGLGNWLAPW